MNSLALAVPLVLGATCVGVTGGELHGLAFVTPDYFLPSDPSDSGPAPSASLPPSIGLEDYILRDYGNDVSDDGNGEIGGGGQVYDDIGLISGPGGSS